MEVEKKEDAASGDSQENQEDKQDSQDTGADASPEDAKGDQDQSQKKEEDAELPVRSSSKDFFIGKRMASKGQKQDKQEDDQGQQDKSDIESVVDKVVGKHLQPLLDKQKADADEAELQAVLAKPEFKPYEKQIRRHMTHEAYTGVPVLTIAKSLAFDDAMKLGAKQKQEADDEANRSGSAGSSSRKDKGAMPDFGTMSSKEFAEYQRTHVPRQ